MAARNRTALSERTRERIKTSMIVNRLTDHIDGKLELTPTQVTAALGLLKKTLPDLKVLDLGNADDEGLEVRIINHAKD